MNTAKSKLFRRHIADNTSGWSVSIDNHTPVPVSKPLRTVLQARMHMILTDVQFTTKTICYSTTY